MKNEVSTPMAVVLVVGVLAVIGAAVWFFMFREPKPSTQGGAPPTGDAARQPGMNTPAGGQFSKPGVD